jgi:di/tricarboxylate transporter
LSDSTICFLVLGAVVVLFITSWIPVELTALGAALTLYLTDVLDVNETFAGFGDPVVIFIAALFVVSEGLDAAGLTNWAGQELIVRAGASRTRLIVLMMTLAAVLTALINPNGSTAALLPVVVVMALRAGRPPSQLLMPLAFAAHPGSMLALTGTVVNVIVSDYAADSGEGRFGFFEFALVGIPLTIGCILIVVFFGERLLPVRKSRSTTADFSQHAHTLLRQYQLDPEKPLLTERYGAAEIVIPPRSESIGDEVFPGMLTESGDLMVVAVQRGGEDLGERPTKLAAGDTVLVRGTWTHLEANLQGDPDVLVVDPPDLIRRQAVPLGPRAWMTLAIVGAMVVLLVTGAFPAAVTSTLAASALVLARVVTVKQAFRSISWSTVVLIGGLIPLSTAMIESGAADKLATLLVDTVGEAGPYALVVGLFLLTVTLGQLISNTATALIVAPIAVSAALELDINVHPMLMTVTVAAAASFLTPVATPANLMVMEPGGYRFTDYWKLGLPMLAWFLIVAVALIPLFWDF